MNEVLNQISVEEELFGRFKKLYDMEYGVHIMSFEAQQVVHITFFALVNECLEIGLASKMQEFAKEYNEKNNTRRLQYSGQSIGEY